MKDRATERMYLVAAVFTLITLAPTYSVVTRLYDTAFSAGGHTVVGLFEYEVETGVIVREQFIEAFDGNLFHIFSILQGLHVVKG